MSSTSHLIATHHRRRRYSTEEPSQITTPPSKWPGVSNLRFLLAHEKDEDSPRLNILLCEAFVASYMALLTYALATCDCHILYRLAGQKFSELTWASLFGGGVKKLLRVAHSTNAMNSQVIIFFLKVLTYFINDVYLLIQKYHLASFTIPFEK